MKFHLDLVERPEELVGLAQQTFMVSRLTVERGSGLAGLAMNELSANTRVVALTRYATTVMEHPPRRGTRFEAGDLAYLVGPYQELLDVLRRARVRRMTVPAGAGAHGSPRPWVGRPRVRCAGNCRRRTRPGFRSACPNRSVHAARCPMSRAADAQAFGMIAQATR